MVSNSFTINIIRFFYTLAVRLYGWGIKIYSPWNVKAKYWIDGRRNWRSKLGSMIQAGDRIILFHAASLGEAEQGLPIIKAIKQNFPHYKIGISFFSPSGYQNFKDQCIDFKCYLPLDTPANAKDFVKILKPEIMFFIKYEVWFNLIEELQKNKIPVLLAPAIFSEKQWYFNTLFKKFTLPALRKLHAILVQDKASEILLKKYHFNNVEVCGDTRIDRVLEIAKTSYENEVLHHFTNTAHFKLIAGSTWPQDEKLIRALQKQFPQLQIIIAPHDLSKDHIQEFKENFGGEMAIYSNYSFSDIPGKLLLIDNVGLLSRIYRYSDIAYIGGGFGVGLHNTLEAAAYGMPVIFGPNHKKFIEPSLMIENGFGHEVKTEKDLVIIIGNYLNDAALLKKKSELARNFILKKSGATEIIYSKIKSLLTP